MLAADRFQKSRKPNRHRVEDLFARTEIEDTEFFFDLESELTEERIAKMFEALERSYESKEWHRFCETACAIKTLFPDREIRPDLFTDETRQEIIDHIKEETMQFHTYAPQLRALHAFFGQKTDISLEELFPERVRKAELEGIRTAVIRFGDDRVFDFNYNAVYISLLDPTEREEFSVQDEIYEVAEQALKKEKNTTSVPSNGDPDASSLNLLYLARLKDAVFLFPQRKREILSDPRFLQRLCKDVLDQIEKEESWISFAACVEDIAILSADRVDVLSPGRLQLTRSPKKFVGHQSLPQAKEY